MEPLLSNLILAILSAAGIWGLLFPFARKKNLLIDLNLRDKLSPNSDEYRIVDHYISRQIHRNYRKDTFSLAKKEKLKSYQINHKKNNIISILSIVLSLSLGYRAYIIFYFESTKATEFYIVSFMAISFFYAAFRVANWEIERQIEDKINLN